MKKFYSLLLITALCLSLVLTAPARGASNKLGDVDGDGTINVVDATCIQRYLAKLTSLSDAQTRRGMVTEMDKLSIVDATCIQRYLARIVSEFPAQAAYDAAVQTQSPPQKAKYIYTALPKSVLRKEKKSSSDGIDIPYMTELKLLEEYEAYSTGRWLKVQYQGKAYYLWEEAGGSRITYEKSDFLTYTTNNKYQKAVLERAVSFLNLPTGYAHQTSTGEKSEDGKYYFDCSGFVSYIFDTVMEEYVPTYDVSASILTLYETTSIINEGLTGQFNAKTVIAAGEKLDESKLKPCDVLFFNLNDSDDGREVTHCGIYLGRGEFIHCSYSWGGGVCVMPLKALYLDSFVAAKRMLPSSVKVANKTMYTASVNNYIYESRSVSSSVKDVLSADEEVTVRYTGGNWAYVKYGSKYGFILLKNLKDEADTISETRYVARISQKLYTDRNTSSDFKEVFIGEELIYHGRYSDSNYYKVSYNSKKYFIYYADGDINDVLKTKLSDVRKILGTYKLGSTVNVRSAPKSTDSSNIVGKLSAGTEVMLIAQSDNSVWAYIMYDFNKFGFIISDNLIK